MSDQAAAKAIIVEVEMVISLVTRSYLEQLGCRVVSEARSGEEAVDGIDTAYLMSASISSQIILVSAFARADRPLLNGSLYLKWPLSKTTLQASLELLDRSGCGQNEPPRFLRWPVPVNPPTDASIDATVLQTRGGNMEPSPQLAALYGSIRL